MSFQEVDMIGMDGYLGIWELDWVTLLVGYYISSDSCVDALILHFHFTPDTEETKRRFYDLFKSADKFLLGTYEEFKNWDYRSHGDNIGCVRLTMHENLSQKIVGHFDQEEKILVVLRKFLGLEDQ